MREYPVSDLLISGICHRQKRYELKDGKSGDEIPEVPKSRGEVTSSTA